MWWAGASFLHAMDNFCGIRGKVLRRGTPKHRGECLFAALKPSFRLESFQLVTVAFTAGFVAGFIFAVWYLINS